MLKCLTPKDIKSPNGSLLLYGHENEIEIKASVQKLWAKQKKIFHSDNFHYILIGKKICFNAS